MHTPIALDNNYFVAPQIFSEELAALKALGFERIINNRPNHEVDDQPLSMDLKEAVSALGLEYIDNPVDVKNLGELQVETQTEAVASVKKTLAFCRTGVRSSILWVLMNHANGKCYHDLKEEVSAKGFALYHFEEAMAALVK